MASSVVVEATKPSSPPVPKGMRQKAQAVKPLKDLSDATSLDTLLSRPTSPLPKSHLSSPSKTMGSPSATTSGAVVTPAKQQTKSPFIVTPTSPPTSPKPSASRNKKKEKVVASLPRYSHENSYSNYFFKFENESPF